MHTCRGPRVMHSEAPVAWTARQRIGGPRKWRGRSFQSLRTFLRTRLLPACVATLCTVIDLHSQPTPVGDVDVLTLALASKGASLPVGWATRAVRGRQLPMSRIVDTSGIRFMRLSGQGSAGWFARELPTPLPASSGHLQWTWRVPLAPFGADVARSEVDDAALRVFVVFARHGRFARRPRVLYYSLADGNPAPDRADAAYATRIAGRPALARDWVQAIAEPFGDYRRVWGSAPPQIVAIGVMQDSDQTRRATIGDIKSLIWRNEDAAHP